MLEDINARIDIWSSDVDDVIWLFGEETCNTSVNRLIHS